MEIDIRDETPLVPSRLLGQSQVRDWRTRTVKCPVSDPKCIANHLESDYCIHDTDGLPEAPEGVGAVAGEAPSDHELQETPVDAPTPVAERTGRRADRKDKLVKSFTKPVRYPFARGCGHQFVELQQPSHRNCEICWNAFFWNQNELTENIARNVQEQGPEVVQAIHGKKFLTHFLRFAILLAKYEKFKQNPGTECAAVEEEKNGPQQHQSAD